MIDCQLDDHWLCSHDEEEILEEVRLLHFAGLFCVSLALVVHAVVHRMQWEMIPESLVTVVLGLVLGFVLYWSPLLGDTRSLDPRPIQWMFAACLNLVCLPVIIFESGWSVRIRDFVSQFGYIMVFAIIGTMAAVGIIAGLLWATRDYHAMKSLKLCFAMASLISSVDPVSTLATFGNLNVDPLLYILIFGESQINDAVAITFFRSINEAKATSVCHYILQMLKVFFGSVAVGVGLAVMLILVFRYGRIGHAPAQSVLLVFVSCFFTFTAGELAGFSGIIAVLFNSILLGCYLSLYLSAESMALTSFLLKQMSSLADTMIFLFSGVLGVFVVAGEDSGLVLGLILSAICLVARFLTIIPLGCLSNFVKMRVGRHLPKEHEIMITSRHMFMMWHSGLRGGISLVLVSEISGALAPDRKVKSQMINAVFVMVVLYLLVFGSTTGLALRCLGLPLGDQVKDGSMFEDEDKQGWAWKIMMVVRENVLLPLLVPREPQEALPEEATMPSSVMADALREADEAQTLARATSQRLTRANTRSMAKHSSARMNLFGTQDPAHMVSRADILHDASDLRRRRSSAGSLPCGSIAGRPRAGSDSSFSSEGTIDEGDEESKDAETADAKDAGSPGTSSIRCGRDEPGDRRVPADVGWPRD